MANRHAGHVANRWLPEKGTLEGYTIHKQILGPPISGAAEPLRHRGSSLSNHLVDGGTEARASPIKSMNNNDNHSKVRCVDVMSSEKTLISHSFNQLSFIFTSFHISLLTTDSVRSPVCLSLSIRLSFYDDREECENGRI